MNDLLKLLRGAVRPVTTLGLVAAFVVAALSPLFGAEAEDAEQAITALGGPTGILLGVWFQSRNKPSETA